MVSSALLFLSISVTFLIPTTDQYSPDNTMISTCIGKYGNYTENSAYKSNLNTIFSSFSSLPIDRFNGGFYNFSAGVEPDRVNAIGLCRGDIEASDCHQCLHNLRTNLVMACPHQKEAIGWYQSCMFRYSSRSILGLLDNSSTITSSNSPSPTSSSSNATELEQVVAHLVTKLAGKAASGGSVRKFARGSALLGGGSQTVYALVQCTPDLTELDCVKCLGRALHDVQASFPGRVGVTAFNPNCYLTYANDTFHHTSGSKTSPLPNILGLSQSLIFFILFWLA